MEPLLRNIESNAEIEPIPSTTLNKSLPKVYAYADDVNATIKDSAACIQALFREYERLTRMSGLELNADKTELMLLGAHPGEKSYDVAYLGRNYNIASSAKIKINGIFFQRDRQQMKNDNVDAVVSKMEAHFKRWSRRSLTTLGKVLIVKSFGISQIIYLLQCMCLEPAHFKKLNSYLYKFIWNKHYLAAKAPERIKREIVNTPIKLGGFGMLDVVSLDESIKLKALGRLVSTNHPFLKSIKEHVDLTHYFYPSVSVFVDELSAQGVKLLAEDRDKIWDDIRLEGHRDLLNSVADTEIGRLVGDRGKASIPFFVLWSRGARKVSDLTVANLRSLNRYIEHRKFKKLELAIRTRSGHCTASFGESYFVSNRDKPLEKLTSKEIREARSGKDLIKTFKLGIQLREVESCSWGLKLSKLTSTKHKNLLLRVAHGEIYTKVKLHKYGLTDSPMCPRCQTAETLTHKFIECPYVQRIWSMIFKYTQALTTDNLRLEQPAKAILGCHLNSNGTMLTINAEVLQRIMSLRDDQDYLLHPRLVAKQVFLFLAKKEKKAIVKNDLESILTSMNM